MESSEKKKKLESCSNICSPPSSCDHQRFRHMVSSSLLSRRMTINLIRARFSLAFSTHLLLPAIFSSRFSSLCKGDLLSFPSQTPPVPKKIPFTVSAHGRSWEDPYHWMANTKDPDLSNYLKQENSYTEAFMVDTQNLQQKLLSEMTSRMPPRISTPPERWGPWSYYQYIPEGKEYPVLCRRLRSDNNGWLKALTNYVTRGFGREETLLDWNEIAEHYGYVHVGTCRVSPDHNFLAYTLDITGDERFMLQIKDLRSGFVLPKSRDDGVVSLAWAQDGSTLFYTVSDEMQRPYRVFCRRLGPIASDTAPILTESDSSCCLDITNTKDGKFITVNSNSRTSSEVYIIDAVNPQDGFRRVRKRVPVVQYFLEHHHGFFYILTNAPLGEDDYLDESGFYLARCRDEDIQSDNWQVIILPGKDFILQDMDIFDEHLVLFLDKKGFPMICSFNMPINANCKKNNDEQRLEKLETWIKYRKGETVELLPMDGAASFVQTGFELSYPKPDNVVFTDFELFLSQQPLEIDDLDPWFFPLPSSSCRIVPGSNHDFMVSVYRVVLSSPVMPDVIVDYDMSNRKFCVVQREVVVGVTGSAESRSLTHNAHTKNSLDTLTHSDQNLKNMEVQNWSDLSEAIVCERKEVISHDGVHIPLTILYSREIQQNSHAPGILHGYGAYGDVLDKSWCADRLSILDRGWVVAFADVRGGSGGDSSWHKSGSGSDKLNSIYDFIACGRYLVKEGYVHKDRLSAIGFSAGGLLVGAAINMYPDLFRAAILKVPFLDICNTLLNPFLPLSILDYEEFGDPRIQSQFNYIFRYSPYDNITPGVCYPPMLVTASFHDSRVRVWEAAKWVAKVREITCSTCSCSVVLKTNMDGGHFGEGGRFGQCEETAFDYAFLMKVTGILEDNR